MEAAQVIEKILSDAHGEAEQIVGQAKQQAAADKARLDASLTAYSEQTDAMAAKAGEDKMSHVLAAARMEIAKTLLGEKRAILDDVFSEALEKLKALPDTEYRKLIVKLMFEAVETGEEEVILDRSESRIDAELINQVNQRLSQDDQRGALTLSEKRLDIGGGFLLKRGKIMTNVSFGVLIERARKDLEIELSHELFA